MYIIGLIIAVLVIMFLATFPGLFKSSQEKPKDPPWTVYNDFMRVAELNDKGCHILKFKFAPVWMRWIVIILCVAAMYGGIVLLTGKKETDFTGQFFVGPFIIIVFYYVLEKGLLNLFRKPEWHIILDDEGIYMPWRYPFKILWNDIEDIKQGIQYSGNNVKTHYLGINVYDFDKYIGDMGFLKRLHILIYRYILKNDFNVIDERFYAEGFRKINRDDFLSIIYWYWQKNKS